MIIDSLTDAIKQTRNPVAVGLDTDFSYLPQEITGGFDSERDGLKQAADMIFEFNKALLDTLSGIVPCVKVQSAYYETYGHEGVRVFEQTIGYAKKRGFITIADAKRNDIGSTAAAYAKAFLGETSIAGRSFTAVGADFVTVNAYFGSDGVLPFTELCEKYDKGCFILVRTSNPSAGELQDLICEGRPLYEAVGERVSNWGKALIGNCGYSSVGAVVGATYPEEGARLRGLFPNVFFLVPGYGAQGASAKDLAGCFDERGGGAVINASRSVICAYKNKRYEGLSFTEAAKREVIRMRDEISEVTAG